MPSNTPVVTPVTLILPTVLSKIRFNCLLQLTNICSVSCEACSPILSGFLPSLQSFKHYLLSAQVEVYSVTASSPETHIKVSSVRERERRLCRWWTRWIKVIMNDGESAYSSGSNRRLWPQLVSGSWLAAPASRSRCTSSPHPSSAESTTNTFLTAASHIQQDCKKQTLSSDCLLGLNKGQSFQA